MIYLSTYPRVLFLVVSVLSSNSLLWCIRHWARSNRGNISCSYRTNRHWHSFDKSVCKFFYWPMLLLNIFFSLIVYWYTIVLVFSSSHFLITSHFILFVFTFLHPHFLPAFPLFLSYFHGFSYRYSFITSYFSWILYRILDRKWYQGTNQRL